MSSVPTLLFDDFFLVLFWFVLFSSGHAYDCGRQSPIFSATGSPDEALSPAPLPRPQNHHLPLTPQNWREKVGPHLHTHTPAGKQETWTLASCANWTLPSLQNPHAPTPAPPQPSSDPPHVTNVCCLGPSLRLGRELSIFIFLSFFGSLVWMTKNGLLTYKYLSSVKIRGKDCSSVIVVGSFNPFLALTCTVRQQSRVQFKDFTTWGHIYTVGGISPAPETLLWCFELVIFVSRLKILPRSLYAFDCSRIQRFYKVRNFSVVNTFEWPVRSTQEVDLAASQNGSRGISPWRPVQVKIVTLLPSPSVIFLQAHLTPRTGKG